VYILSLNFLDRQTFLPENRVDARTCVCMDSGAGPKWKRAKWLS